MAAAQAPSTPAARQGTPAAGTQDPAAPQQPRDPTALTIAPDSPAGTGTLRRPGEAPRDVPLMSIRKDEPRVQVGPLTPDTGVADVLVGSLGIVAVAVIGALVLSVLFIFLWATASGTRHRFDLILNVKWMRASAELPMLARVLERHCLRIHIANQHFGQGVEGIDLSYRLLLRNPARAGEMLAELAEVQGVERVSSVQAADESEI